MPVLDMSTTTTLLVDGISRYYQNQYHHTRRAMRIAYCPICKSKATTINYGYEGEPQFAVKCSSCEFEVYCEGDENESKIEAIKLWNHVIANFKTRKCPVCGVHNFGLTLDHVIYCRLCDRHIRFIEGEPWIEMFDRFDGSAVKWECEHNHLQNCSECFDFKCGDNMNPIKQEHS